MPPLPSRKSLESMRRADLQKLCKDYGVKANLKSEALIDLLLDTQRPVARIASTNRSVSTRVASRAGPSRISSVIIHDTDEEDEEPNPTLQEESTAPQRKSSRSIPASQSSIPLARSRKGKEQTRLGVGRPVAAGGAGPRALTRSLSMSMGKGLRARSSRSTRPTEATILEEEPEQTQVEQGTLAIQSPEQLANSHSQPSVKRDPQLSQPTSISLTSLESIDKHVAEALRPLHEQVQSLKAELEAMQIIKVEFGKLKNQVAEMDNLQTQVQDLSNEVEALRLQIGAPLPSGHLGSDPEDLNIMAEISRSEAPISTSTPLPPSRRGLASRSLLGKRSRQIDAQLAEGLVADNISSQEHLTHHPSPAKRAKTSSDNDELQPGDSSANFPSDLLESTRTSTRIPNGTNNEDANRPSGNNEPLPSIPELSTVAYSSPLNPAKEATSDIRGHPPFTFSLLPLSTTPSQSMFMPSFPYPEPPQSPSPAGTSSVDHTIHREGRTDIFQPFGLPPPARSSRAKSRQLADPDELTGAGAISPALLTQQLSSTSDHKLPQSAPEQSKASTLETPLMKRTMYGTELDGDTRFGDFGVEGVGKNSNAFWTSGRY